MHIVDRITLGLIVALFCPSIVLAQASDAVGKNLVIATGVLGQRQTRAEAAPNTLSSGRIQNRLQNRVQTRVRNRLDRFYVPKADTLSPFEVADEQVRDVRLDVR